MKLRYGRRLRKEGLRKNRPTTIVNPMADNLDSTDRKSNNMFFRRRPAYGDKDDQRCGKYISVFAIIMCIAILL
jgi:hypothetical protein